MISGSREMTMAGLDFKKVCIIERNTIESLRSESATLEVPHRNPCIRYSRSRMMKLAVIMMFLLILWLDQGLQSLQVKLAIRRSSLFEAPVFRIF